MVSVSKRSKQLIAAAGLALGIIALGACSGGGGSITSPVAPNQPANTSGGTWSGALSSAGMSVNLPSVAGFNETLTFPANNAAAGTTLTIKLSTTVPAGMPGLDPDMHVALPYFYLQLSSSKSVTLNGFPGFKLAAPAHFNYGNLPAKIGYYDPKTGWTHVGDLTWSGGGLLTFTPTKTPVALLANTTYFALPYTCGGPSPSPTPTGVVSCAASGSGPIGILCIGPTTYAFVGKGPTGLCTSTNTGPCNVEQIDISKGAKGSASSTLFHTYTLDFAPTSCNGDEKHLRVFCTAFTSSKVADINGSAHTFTEFDSGTVGFLSFSGGSCMVCMVTYDIKDDAFILLEHDNGGSSFNPGKFVSYNRTTHAVMRTILDGDPNENPGYDYVSNKVWTPAYSATTLQVADFNDGNLYSDSSSVSGIGTPDSASVDVATHIGETPNEFSNLATIANLGTATFNTTTKTFTTTTGQATLNSAAKATTCGLDDDGSAVDSVLHLTFFSGEFCSPAALGFMLLPATKTGTTISDWAFVLWPATPGGAWVDSGDPHPIAAYNDPTNCPDCALVVNSRFSFLAVIDLFKLEGAPRSASDTHSIDPAYDLVANHVVGFYPI